MARRKPKKKKSPVPAIMIGSAISGTALILVFLAVWLGNKPKPDRPTSASAEANLVKQALPADLPRLADVSGGGGSIDELLSTIEAEKGIMNAGGYEKEKAQASERIIAALRKASGSEMSPGLLDQRIPPKHFGSSEVKEELKAVIRAVTTYVGTAKQDLRFEEARQAAFAQVLLGRKIFEGNTRLKSRQAGIDVMNRGLARLREINQAAYQDGEITQEELVEKDAPIAAWSTAVKTIEDNWKIKLMSIDTIASKEGKPNTADLKTIALKDQDPTFRIFAARRLGYALFERGDPGNQTLMKDTIERLKSGPDKAVAAAAEDGASIEDADEWQALRK